MPPKGRPPKKTINAIVSVDDDFDAIKEPAAATAAVVAAPIKKPPIRRAKKSAEDASIVAASPAATVAASSAISSRGTRNIPEWYFDLTTEYQAIYGEKVVVFLQVGQFFEIYGVRNPAGSGYLYSRIEEVASLCNLNIANKNSSFKDMPMVMAGFKPMYLDRYVPRLHEAGYTIPIYIETHEYADGSKHRELDSILSPGTSFTSDTSVVSNNVACIVLHYIAGNRWIGEKKLVSGFACVDVLSGDFVVDEFHTDYATHDPGVFDDLERVCSIYQPSELIVIYNSAGDTILSSERVNEILRFAGVHAGISVRLVDTTEPGNFSTKALNAEKQTYQKLAFERFFTIYDYGSFEHSTGFADSPVAATAACFLLDYVHSHNSHLTEKIQEPIMNPASTHLRLANHSLRQLHIIEDDQGRNMGKARSVQTLLNNTDTAMGGRLFKQYLLNPIISPEELNLRYDTISRALENYDDLLGARFPLRNIKDIERMYRRIVLERTTPDDIFSLHSSLLNTAATLTALEETPHFVAAIEALMRDKTLAEWNSTARGLIDRIEHTLDLETCSGVSVQRPDVNVFRRGIYADVDAIHKKSLDAVDIVNAVAKELTDLTAAALGSSSAANDTEYCKIHVPERSPWYLEMTRVRSVALSKYLAGLTARGGKTLTITYKSRYDGSTATFDLNISTLNFVPTASKSSSSVKIENDEIRRICDSVMTNESELRGIVGTRFAEFVAELKPLHADFIGLARMIATIDLALTNARNAKTHCYCRPEIVTGAEAGVGAEAGAGAGAGGSHLNIRGIRHPIIERIQTDEIYVANDVVLDETQNTILIFGTNAVGKTSLIRSVGVAVVLAQAGMFVPATAMEFRPFKHIFTRILGNDNLFRGLSTFAVEMSELRTILRDSTEDSLVLGDELCSGTELGSAISIFIASLEHLHRRNVKSMFATHFHEITRRHEIASLSNLRMKHMSVAYSPESGALIYFRKLEDGPGSDMYGLEVCKSMRLPEWFITRAYDLREATPRMISETSSIRDDNDDAVSVSTSVSASASASASASTNRILHSKASEPATLLSKISQYSYKKALNMCELCKVREATETHHLIPQATASDDGIVICSSAPLHKNHPANLMSICHTCHENYTKENKDNKKHRRVKTTKGNIILEA